MAAPNHSGDSSSPCSGLTELKDPQQTDLEKSATNPAATDMVVSYQPPGSAIPTCADGKETAGTKPETQLDEAHADVEYPVAWKLGLITIGLCLSVFCMALDNTILATAIPRITDQFHALEDVGWYGSVYLLTTCAVQLIFGKLYTFYSVKWVYLFALFLFELGSLVCGAAPTSLGLILGRAVAGLGAAGVFSGALLIVNQSMPLRRRPIYLGLLGSMYGVASVVGPLMGGAFTDHISWRWCFYINLPFGGVTIAFIILFLHLPKPKGRETKPTFKKQIQALDPLGTVLFIPAAISLLLALQWGGARYPWNDGRIIALFVVFGVLSIGFIAVQVWLKENATIPPRVLLTKTVWTCAVFGACIGSAFFVMIYYLPIWFQAIKGTSAVQSGIETLPMILSVVISSLMSGALVASIGYYTPFMIASSILTAIGAGLLSTFDTDTSISKCIGYQILFGVGVGIGTQQTMVAIQASLDAADIAIGTTIIIFSQTLGGSVFICVAQNIFQNSLISNISNAHIPGLDPASVVRVGATQVQTLIPEKYLSDVLHAYNGAITSTFYVAAALGALSLVGSLLVPWTSVKGKKAELTGV